MDPNKFQQQYSFLPNDGVVCKVNAVVFPDTWEAIYGAAFVSINGDFIAGKRGLLRCTNDLHMTESLAVTEALSWMKNEDRKNVQVEMDCLNVCHLINSSTQDLSYVGTIISLSVFNNAL
nr:uncharacterized protein LOC109151883 [Ipomoea batatas]